MVAVGLGLIKFGILGPHLSFFCCIFLSFPGAEKALDSHAGRVEIRRPVDIRVRR